MILWDTWNSRQGIRAGFSPGSLPHLAKRMKIEDPYSGRDLA